MRFDRVGDAYTHLYHQALAFTLHGLLPEFFDGFSAGRVLDTFDMIHPSMKQSGSPQV